MDGTGRVFISYSHQNKGFAELVAANLREIDLNPWIDKEQVLIGDDVLESVGHGLTTSDTLVFLISKESLESEWCKRELEFVTHREITEKKVLVVPIVIDDIQITDLPWYLHTRHVFRIQPDPTNARLAANAVRQVLERRFELPELTVAQAHPFVRDRLVDGIIADVRLGDWQSAQRAAIEVLKRTDINGQNVTFERLLTYCDSDNQDVFWRAIQTIESCVSLSPRLIDYAVIKRMASHRNYSVRASAASICMDLANFAPDRVPIDILIKLSVFNEDWYVQAPANAALKTLASSMPGVLQIFFSRIESDDKDECAHSAAAVLDIGVEEPKLLGSQELKKYLARMTMVGNRDAAAYLEAALKRVRSAEPAMRYKYGL